MVKKFKEWWDRPLQSKDRVAAVFIGALGAFWVGTLGRLILGPMPVAMNTLVYWAIASIIVGVILGLLFPKPVTVVLFPFSMFGIGGS